MNIFTFLVNYKIINKKEDNVIKKIINFEKLTSYIDKSIEFNLYQIIKCLYNYDKKYSALIIKYLINVEKIILNLFLFLPNTDKKDFITTILLDSNHLIHNVLNHTEIINYINLLKNNIFVKKYNKVLYDINCINTNSIIELLVNNKNYIPLCKTEFRTNYSYCLHRLIILILKISTIENNKINNTIQIMSYGDISIILYFLYFPVIKIKSYLGKMFYDTFQSFLFTIGFIEYFQNDIKSYRDKLKNIADFIICSGHVNNEYKFISNEEYQEIKKHILSINFEARITKILKKYNKY